MSLIQIYKRALGLLAPEKYLAIGLAAAGVVIAATQLAEPILFGRVVDALSKGENAFGYIGLWALLGLFGIVAGVIVGINADRLAHRQKQAQLVSVFESTIALPQRLHAARGSGATIRTILAGTSALFWLWLGAMRDQVSALFGISFAHSHRHRHGPEDGGDPASTRRRLYPDERLRDAKNFGGAGGSRKP